MEILWHQAWRLGLSWKKWARITQCLHSPCSFLPALLGVSHPSQPKVSPASLLLLPLAFFLEQGIPAAWRSSWTSPLLLFSWYCFCYHFWWESKNNSKNNTKTVLVFLVFFVFLPAQPLLESWCDGTSGMIFHAHNHPGNAPPASQHQLHELPSFSTH